MSQPTTSHPKLSEATSQMVALLEHHCEHDPALLEELQHHYVLAEALAEQHRRAERSLLAWQTALARRWSCEVMAQRAAKLVRHQLEDLHSDASPYSILLTPAYSGAARTPRGLLQEVRNLEVAFKLLAPQTELAAEAHSRLRHAGDELADAIAQTDSCEAERRHVVSEQRVVVQLVERANERARRLIDRHTSDDA